MMLKILWCCTKKKPYLQLNRCVLPTEYDRYILDKKQCYSAFGEPLEKLNGKIVAESDFEVEEIAKARNYYDMKPEAFDNLYYTRTLDCEQLSFSSHMATEQFDNYLKDKTGYAIQIKGLHIFDKARELSDYHISYYNKDLKMMREKHLEKAPQNMCRAFDVNGTYIVISVHPEELYLILSGLKTVVIKKRVLKEMLW